MAKPIDGFKGDSVDIPLTVGSILGTRSFRINDEGMLTGVTVSGIPYKPGENVAVCAADHAEQDKVESNDETTVVSSPLHSMSECEHGFWAYYDEKDYFSNTGTVSGVLEGYGEVIVGKKGFRSSKARVRALVAPDSRYYSYDFPLIEIIILACALFGFSSVYSYSLESLNVGSYDYSVFALLSLVLTILFQLAVVFYRIGKFFLERYAMSCFKRGKIKPSGSFHKWMFKKAVVVKQLQAKLEQFEKVKINYPGIPVFSSYSSMVKYFPELKKQKNKWKAQ